MDNSKRVIMDKELYNAVVKGHQTFLNKAHNEEYYLRQTYRKNNFLHLAIRHNQYGFMKAVLTTIKNEVIHKLLYQQNCDGDTPLHVAVEVGNMDIFWLFLEYKGAAGQRDKGNLWMVKNAKGNTPLHVAFLYGNFEVAKLLLLRVHDLQLVRDVNKSHETPLHLAIKYQTVGDKEELIKIINLLDQKQVASVEGVLSGTHLLPIIELLLQKDTSVACWQDANGLTPLLRAASLEAPHDIEVIKVILRHHPQSAEMCDHSGKTILHHLSRSLSYEEAQDLLGFPETKSLINYRDRDGNTPAHVAVFNKNFNLVRVLLCCSADFLKVNDEGISAADLLQQSNGISEAFTEGISKLTNEERKAVSSLDEEFLRSKLASDGKVFLHSRAPDGRNILHLLMKSLLPDTSVESQNFLVSYVKEILDIYPDLLCQIDHQGNTPVHYLAKGSTFMPSKVFGTLADFFNERFRRAAGCQSPWQMKNTNGNTPLHESVLSIYSTLYIKSAFKLWRKDRSVIRIKNNRGETPFHLLANIKIKGGNDDDTANDMQELATLMYDCFTPLYTPDEDGLTPFLRAVQDCRSDLIRIYCTHDNSIIFQKFPDDGNTALHIALEKGNFEYAALYLSTAVKDNTQQRLLEISNNKGDTPADLIGSLQHLPSAFEQFLWKEGLLVGRRSMYGVPMEKIEAYTNTIGVIAGLLATVSFTAGFTVPGGLNQDKGTPILMQKVAFQVFMVSNSLALCFSMMVLFCLLWIMATQNRKESILLIDTSILLLELSFYATLLTFMMGVYVTTINIVPWIAILCCAFCCSLILLMHRWFIKDYLGPFCTRLIMWSTHIRNVVKTNVLHTSYSLCNYASIVKTKLKNIPEDQAVTKNIP